MRGSHCIKTWAATQKNITLSSGEAELVAAVKMSCELIGMMQIAKDWGVVTAGSVHVDSSAALGVVKRKGSGKLRHIRVGQLWIQEKAEEGELTYTKVSGKKNPGDLMTKHLPRTTAESLTERIGLRIYSGRAATSLGL